MGDAFKFYTGYWLNPDTFDVATPYAQRRFGTASYNLANAPRKIANVEGPKSKNPVALAQKLADPSAVTYNNPVAIADEKSGAVHFLFCLEYARCFYMRSDSARSNGSKSKTRVASCSSTLTTSTRRG